MGTRDERIVFRITAERKEALERLAQEMGVTVSALCAVVVGEWLERKAREQAVQDAMLKGGMEVLRRNTDIPEDVLGELVVKVVRELRESTEARQRSGP